MRRALAVLVTALALLGVSSVASASAAPSTGGGTIQPLSWDWPGSAGA